MADKISFDDFVAVMQECFSRGQELTFTPTGTSMLPMLDGKNDTVTFSPPPDRLKKYDVAFYRRSRTGQLVLHRLVGFDKNGGYIFSGDNQYYYEYGVGVDDVLAVVTAFTHDGKTCLPTDFRYRFYIRRMMLKKRLRMCASKVYHFLFKRK
ncbi:MAG: S24/S26 family peptidase [Ruminococcus sp.]|nr:S24/S26 family peptidase [Ruminococcus sp.]